MGGSHNCLVVQVTDNELDIHPFVPFNWLFLPEIYGLEYRVPLGNIISANTKKKLFRQGVEIEFKASDRKIENVFLLLKKPEDFLLAIGQPKRKEGKQFIHRGGVITAKPIEPGA
jgi:hypothetical protein